MSEEEQQRLLAWVNRLLELLEDDDPQDEELIESLNHLGDFVDVYLIPEAQEKYTNPLN